MPYNANALSGINILFRVFSSKSFIFPIQCTQGLQQIFLAIIGFFLFGGSSEIDYNLTTPMHFYMHNPNIITVFG